MCTLWELGSVSGMQADRNIGERYILRLNSSATKNKRDMKVLFYELYHIPQIEDAMLVENPPINLHVINDQKGLIIVDPPFL